MYIIFCLLCFRIINNVIQVLITLDKNLRNELFHCRTRISKLNTNYTLRAMDCYGFLFSMNINTHRCANNCRKQCKRFE